MSTTSLLEGVRVVAVELYGAGPYGTQLMSELGAEVIKVESPSMGGDVSRTTGPPFLGEQDSQFFQTFSRGKKSVALEIKTPEGRAEFEKLVRSADAVVNNLRGDQPKKLSIDYPSLKAVKPSIVCAHLSAYGRDNSRASWPGYDYLMQAEAGFMSLTGEPDAPPTRFGLSMVDFMTGTMTAFAALAAIIRARATGTGCDVDVSLFDVALHQLSYPAVWAMNGGPVIGRLPRGAHPSISPSQIVRTKDGWGLLMCQTQKFWTLFCDIVGRPDVRDDPRFADIASRRKNLEALTESMDEICSGRSTAEWMALLGGKVPFAPINTLNGALENPYVREVGMRDSVSHDAAPGGRLNMLALPIKVDGVRPKAWRAPRLGEHTEEILGPRR
ncbi:MAG: CoA transferase [Parvularculaceae bacterium]|jgi:crotonobetainyl-CoA:carnitine CoA-transferase CaiB-like acyl-CoA transferase|nr:CoA transferase [Parvularculaceae bacterium]